LGFKFFDFLVLNFLLFFGSTFSKGRKGRKGRISLLLYFFYKKYNYMYNTKVICTYNDVDVFLETDDLTEKDKEFIRDTLYRQELLNILGIPEFNDVEMEKGINNLYEKIKNYAPLKECMLKTSSRFLSDDAEFGLMILFAYDYMYLTHNCVSEYLEKGEVSEKSITKLKMHL